MPFQLKTPSICLLGALKKFFKLSIEFTKTDITARLLKVKEMIECDLCVHITFLFLLNKAKLIAFFLLNN